MKKTMHSPRSLSLRVAKNAFFADLAEQGVSPAAIRVLDQSGARTALDALSLLQAFPILSVHTSISAPELSNLIMRLDRNAARAFATSLDKRVRHEIILGASAPPESPWQDGRVVPLDTEEEPANAEAPQEGGVTVARCLHWPVRDQGSRGTCVAFAATAVLEIRECQQGAQLDFSEQFLYHAIKTNTNDGHPASDGTFLEFARDSIHVDGICAESLWPYAPNLIANNAGHTGLGNPTAVATADAARRTSLLNHGVGATQGNAALILAELQAGSPVAITVPVFWDPLSNQNNWSTPTSWSYGGVIDPPPSSVVSGGHAVCVVGFEPDLSEPLGGYFIFRNSWGVSWGASLPGGGYKGPEPGYGQISAAYVDRYLWESLTF
ncbi:papain like protease [Tahibacter aquaticus]|uniref:Papain like protease n=1 Tax=Tahibacter aquaticus TaxID=520092 RepID=A0A4R6YID3_9GAMM|nr:C1 family peptidase [Tahibacter aquaticus]TDR36591.1 papain like protease [Tahibacter aquaticus]